MNDLSDFTKYLTDEELAKVAPMLERLKTLDDRTDQARKLYDVCEARLASVY